ncbi:MAG: hypothetical protein ABIP75_17290 [Pyrinomonadaceae bacterium]
MPKWAKILLITLGSLVVLGIIAVVIAIAAGAYWWNTEGKKFVESSAKAMQEGETFGRKAENRECIPEAVDRFKQNSGIGGTISAKLFLTGCLKTSRETPNFCDGVPRRFDFTKSASWRQQRCREVGLADDPNCQQLFDAVQDHCEKKGSN